MARDYMGIVVNIRRDGISGISRCVMLVLLHYSPDAQLIDFMSSGHSLLETGHFADLVVKCGQKEWKLHRAILCMGSKWFEKALTGDFMVSPDLYITRKLPSLNTSLSRRPGAMRSLSTKLIPNYSRGLSTTFTETRVRKIRGYMYEKRSMGPG